MAIILKRKKDNQCYNIIVDSGKIIGLMGKDYEKFLMSMTGQNIFIVDKEYQFTETTVYNEIASFYRKKDGSVDKILMILLNEFEISKSFLDKNISDLSMGEKRILKYMSMFIFNPSIMVIDDIFLDLDYYWKRKIIYLLRKIHKNTKKTIIIGSNNSDDIYSLCDKVLLVNDNNYYYNDVDVIFHNEELLKKYHVVIPNLVKFIHLAHKKNINLSYSKDIRDLMKEVYRNV